MTERTTVILPGDARGLHAAVELLRAGELVAFPTETVYGLGADARVDAAVARVFEAKGRPSFNPLIVHVSGLEMAEEIAVFTPPARRLAEALWPGPLTLVLNQRATAGISMLTTAGLDTMAVRMPAHDLARRLLHDFAGPLAAPSANPSGQVSPTRAEHVLDGLGGRIAAVLDGGACPVGLESTIVGFDGETCILLRPGGFEVERIEAVLGAPLDIRALRHVNAPGQLLSHYAPRAALRLDASGPGRDEVWLGFGAVAALRPGLNLSPGGNLVEAAANLFAFLREVDAIAASAGVARIAVAPIPMTGLGLAINDRLRRAAAPRPGEPWPAETLPD